MAFVARVVADRILRVQVVSDLLVNARQIRERLHRVNAPSSMLAQYAQFLTRNLIEPGVDFTTGIGRDRLARVKTLQRFGVALGVVSIDLALGKINVVRITLWFEQILKRRRFGI